MFASVFFFFSVLHGDDVGANQVDVCSRSVS